MSDDGDHDDVVGVGGRWEGGEKEGGLAACGHRGRSLCGDGELDVHRRVLRHCSMSQRGAF